MARLNDNPTPRPIQNGGYIVGPWFDHVFFILTPLLFVAVAGVISALGIANTWVTLGDPAAGGLEFQLFPTLVITFSMGHIVAVFFRSHLNRTIFKLHPVRFTVVPLTFLTVFLLWEEVWIVALFLIVWADNYHSAMQTFGLGRIYDMRAGNAPQVGRRLDIGLALVIFIGPILSGLTFADALTRMERFDEVGLETLAAFPGWAVAHQSWIAIPVVALMLGYIAFYVASYVRLARQGYRVSYQKVALWVALAVTSVLAWGFNSFGLSFLIMESFHSLQYFALVWWSERENVQGVFGLQGRPGGRWAALVLFLALCGAFGLWASLFATTRFELVLFSVCELMHYWYDGFIWSVRKKQVA